MLSSSLGSYFPMTASKSTSPEGGGDASPFLSEQGQGRGGQILGIPFSPGWLDGQVAGLGCGVLDACPDASPP